MKLTVLTDNAARIDAYYLAEPGVSYFLECDGKSILFDTGYSDVYLRNAEKMGIDLHRLDAAVLSHGHNDHTGGLALLPAADKKLPVYACPEVFCQRVHEGLAVGCPLTEQQVRAQFDLTLSPRPVALTEHLVFLGPIPRANDFESKQAIGTRLAGEDWQPDYLPDDTALVYKGRQGLTVITGCSHSGICNITEYAKTVCEDDRIVGIIGGFHLMQMTPRVQRTVEYLGRLQPKLLCPCHCTCFEARAAIHAAVPVTEVCVGDALEIE